MEPATSAVPASALWLAMAARPLALPACLLMSCRQQG